MSVALLPRLGKGWIQTRSGGRFYPLAPLAEDVRIGDIAWALSNLCRFAGHCEEFYSVAQHSVLVARTLEEAGLGVETVLCGLLHDAAEAYCVDLPAPIKRSGEMGKYRSMEHAIQRCVWERFNLAPSAQDFAAVHWADETVLATEARDLMSPLAPGWGLEELPPPRERKIWPWEPAAARDEFMKVFDRLMASRK